MAVIFSKSLSEANLLNSHNNNIVEFGSDNVLEATDCDINLGGIVVNITPNPDGVFRYNFKDIIKTLINPSNFSDDYIPDIDNLGYVYLDPNLYKLLAVTYTINLTGGTTEASSKNYKFTKSVKQPDIFSRTVIDTTTELLAFLLPFEDPSVKSYNAVYHKGFPFDLPLFSNIPRSITIVNKTNNLSATLDIGQGVNRIVISDGSESFTFEDLLPLVTGFNEIEFQITSDPTEFKTLILEKRESSCAPYLKYYTDYGSYFYYLFDGIYQDLTKTKIIDVVNRDFDDISETFENIIITGKGSSTKKKIFLEQMTDRQRKYLLPIISSPRVELYTRDVFQMSEADSWRGVVLNDGEFKEIDTKRTLYGFKAEISFINYTLTL